MCQLIHEPLISALELESRRIGQDYLISKKLALVASTNGLGHARRLLHLTHAFQSRGYSINFFASREQIDFLAAEADSLQVAESLEFVEIRPSGTESLLRFGFSRIMESPLFESRSEALLSEASLVIADNVFWPLDYNANFFVFGHFLWHQLHLNQANLSGEQSLLDAIHSDLKHASKTLGWIKPAHFSVWDEPAIRSELVIPLIRYESDPDLGLVASPTFEIWSSVGRTGLQEHFRGKLGSFQVRSRESHNMHPDDRPWALIGRPGLGTIRDALSHGVPFFLAEGDSNAELDENFRIYRNLIGLEDDFPRVLKGPSKESWSAWRRISSRSLEVWDSISRPALKIVDQILRYSQEQLEK